MSLKLRPEAFPMMFWKALFLVTMVGWPFLEKLWKKLRDQAIAVGTQASTNVWTVVHHCGSHKKLSGR
jgi:hypothetical protein